jgi:lysophospholipase L1-like esterase
MHVFMMGDSVFDNAAYVRCGEPDVRKQVADLVGKDDQVTSAARDGAVIAGISEQLARRPASASHIVVSAGGNDALQAASVLESRASSISEALETLADVADSFRRQYATLLQQLAETGLPVAVCTIYDPRFLTRGCEGRARLHCRCSMTRSHAKLSPEALHLST